MRILDSTLYKMTGSLVYDDPEPGVDYTDLTYKRRAKMKDDSFCYFEYTKRGKNEILTIVNFVRGCIKKQSVKTGYEWMAKVTSEELFEFFRLYASYYEGSLKDSWFFFKFHYRKYAETPYLVFAEYYGYTDDGKKKKKETSSSKEDAPKFRKTYSDSKTQEEKRYNCGYCWSCKKGRLTGSICIACGWYICQCDACSRGCRFNKGHYSVKYREFEKEKIKEEEEKQRKHEEYEREMREREKEKKINSTQGKILSAGVKIATVAADIGAGAVGTAVRLVPYIVNPESDLVKKIDDTIDSVSNKIKETGDDIATKGGKKIDKILGEDIY